MSQYLDLPHPVSISSQKISAALEYARPNDLQPLAISTNHPSFTPSSPSPVLPRSPYIYSRQLHSSSPTFQLIEDVLAPGDIVGVGFHLKGEPIRLVSNGAPDHSHREPGQEFEVVTQLGTGVHPAVYLVQEFFSRPVIPEDMHMSTIGLMEFDNKSVPSPQIVCGRKYVIKCLSKTNLDAEAQELQMSEVTIHQSLQLHPNIATLHRTLETSAFLLLLLEYVPGEDLFDFLDQSRDLYDLDNAHPTASSVSTFHTFPKPSLLSNMHPSQMLSLPRLRLISSMFSQMCDAVAACHAQHVSHRDIKPENFIVADGIFATVGGRLERKLIVKLTDFGLSTTDLDSADMDCGSAPYMSYECRNNVAPTYRPRAADVWSLGIVLINMLYRCNPWTDTAQGACSSFELYMKDPVNFFMQRFVGMTKPVADVLANKVFCVLPDPQSDSRMSAAEFGVWAKTLPILLGGERGGLARDEYAHTDSRTSGGVGLFPNVYLQPPLAKQDSALEDPSWQPVMLPLLNAHSLMETAARSNRIDHFQPLAVLFIASVRSIMYLTGSLRRDAPILERFPAFSAERRRILATLANLVSHARKASEGNLVGMTHKRGVGNMLRVGDEVVSGTRTFLAVAIKCGVNFSREHVDIRTATEADGDSHAPVEPNGAGPHPSELKLAFPSGPTLPAQVMEAISSTYDHFLSAIASLIGHVHSLPGPYASTPSLGVVFDFTTEVVDIVCKFCVVVDALLQHPELPPGRLDILISAKDELYYSTRSWADSVRLLPSPLLSATSEEAEKRNIIQSTIRVMKAAADCYSAVKVCLRGLAEDKLLVVNLPMNINDPNSFTLTHPSSFIPTSEFTNSHRMSVTEDEGKVIAINDDETKLFKIGFQPRSLSPILESQEISPNNDSRSDDSPAGDVQTYCNSISSTSESIYSNVSEQNLSEQNRPFSIQDLDPIYHPYVAALALRLSNASIYSSASSRTVSTDYGLYYTRRALSQESIAQEQSLE